MRIERGYLETGRDAAIEVLSRTGAVLVVGPAGSGRTRLLDDLASSEAHRRRVWWCRGRRVGGASTEAVLAGAGSDAELVAAVASEPTMLVVDDAHLLDGATLHHVALLAERRDDLALALVVARRPVRPTPELAWVDAAILGQRGAVHLGPLDEAAVAAWITAAPAGTSPAGTPAEVLARTGGWPELVAALVAAGGDDQADALCDLVEPRLALLGTTDRQVLGAMAFGLPAGSAPLLAATGCEAEAVDEALAAGVLEGLLHEPERAVECVAQAVRRLTPSAARSRIAEAVVASGSGSLAVTVGRHLAELGDVSAASGMVYERAADELRRSEPAEAARLYELALAAGRPPATLVTRRAAITLAAGHAETAISMVNGALRDHPDLDDDTRAELGRISGAAWAHAGRPDLAAACYRDADGDGLFAVLPLLLTGDSAGADTILARHTTGDATNAAALLGEGARAWLDGRAAEAVDALRRSAHLAELGGGVEGWPDSPHVITALVAAQALDADLAERMVRSALERDVGSVAFAARHHAVQAWAALRAGRLDDARAALGVAVELAESARDHVLIATLEAAIALRSRDPAELAEVHRLAADSWGKAAPDPFEAEPAAELAHLAARVGADPEIVLRPLEQVAEALGRPVTLSVPLAWARLVVAVARDDAAAARRAADELTGWEGAADGVGGEAIRLFARAGRSFADVLAGKVAAEEVRAVASELTDRGLVFEATRLVGAAGLRCEDAAAARALLGDLRRLRSTQVRSGPSSNRAVAALSEREREVARGVLEGRTHREIGAQLYISAKTVEHHVARVRQKLGASTRAELLAAIRDELALTADPEESSGRRRPAGS